MKKLVLGLLALSTFLHAFATMEGDDKRVLIYTKNGEGYVHENIAASVAAMEKICAEEGILTEVSDQPSVFTSENLERYDAIIFSNSNNEGFDTKEQKKAFQEFIRSGGGLKWVMIK